MKCPHCKEEIDEWSTVSAMMPTESRQVLDDAIAELVREGYDFHRNKRIAMGQALEMLSASYLAERRVHHRAKAEADERALQLPTHTDQGDASG